MWLPELGILNVASRWKLRLRRNAYAVTPTPDAHQSLWFLGGGFGWSSSLKNRIRGTMPYLLNLNHSWKSTRLYMSPPATFKSSFQQPLWRAVAGSVEIPTVWCPRSWTCQPQAIWSIPAAGAMLEPSPGTRIMHLSPFLNNSLRLLLVEHANSMQNKSVYSGVSTRRTRHPSSSVTFKNPPCSTGSITSKMDSDWISIQVSFCSLVPKGKGMSHWLKTQ